MHMMFNSHREELLDSYLDGLVSSVTIVTITSKY